MYVCMDVCTLACIESMYVRRYVGTCTGVQTMVLIGNILTVCVCVWVGDKLYVCILV